MVFRMNLPTSPTSSFSAALNAALHEVPINNRPPQLLVPSPTSLTLPLPLESPKTEDLTLPLLDVLESTEVISNEPNVSSRPTPRESENNTEFLPVISESSWTAPNLLDQTLAPAAEPSDILANLPLPTPSTPFHPLDELRPTLALQAPSRRAIELANQAESHLFGLNDQPQDDVNAFLLFSAAASLGCTKSAGIVGFCLEFGIGTAQSFAACEPWYVRAANAGHALSMARLAFLRRYGRPHVRMNRTESESWQARVSAIGALALPCNRPSVFDFTSSPDLREDPLVWLWWAADSKQNASAQYALGTCFHDGVGVIKSPERAVEWYRKSADQSHPRGEGIMGYCYGEGFGIERDTNLALIYYKRAAEQGETVAMYNVGYCCEEGIGTERDLKLAFQWYQRAAIQGNALAANSLGYFYEEGMGVERDYVQSVHWYRVAAEQGNPWAEHNLAYMYASGLGVERDDEQALMWYRRAAEQGHAGAQNKLGHCLQTGTGCTADPVLAVQWYAKAAAQQYPAACVALAWCYENGTGVSRDLRLALHYVDLSIRLGYSDHVVSDWCISLGLRVSLMGVSQKARDEMTLVCPATAA